MSDLHQYSTVIFRYDSQQLYFMARKGNRPKLINLNTNVIKLVSKPLVTLYLSNDTLISMILVYYSELAFGNCSMLMSFHSLVSIIIIRRIIGGICLKSHDHVNDAKKNHGSKINTWLLGVES